MKIVRSGGTVVLPKGPLSDAIYEAILQIDPNDKSQWTKDGEPQVKAIEKILGKNISEQDRDAVWSSLNKNKTRRVVNEPADK